MNNFHILMCIHFMHEGEKHKYILQIFQQQHYTIFWLLRMIGTQRNKIPARGKQRHRGNLYQTCYSDRVMCL